MVDKWIPPPLPSETFWYHIGYESSRLKFIRKLNQGGFGLIHIVTDGKKQYVTKNALVFYTPDFIPNDLFREYIYMKKLATHPNIQNFHMNLLVDEVCLVFPMEWGDLHDFRLSSEWKREYLQPIMKQIVSAILHAHSHHIMHRDLKPGNILVRKSFQNGGEVSVCVSDWGSARYVKNPKEYMLSVNIGTTRYSPPELLEPQTRRQRYSSYGFELDYWSVGVIWFELERGERLFMAMDPVSILNEMWKYSYRGSIAKRARGDPTDKTKPLVDEPHLRELLDMNPETRVMKELA